MATHPLRTSAPSLVAVGRHVFSLRDGLVAKWSRFLEERQAGTVMLGLPATERLLKLIVNLLAHMSGPLRRETDETWFAATELYGRLAAVRGLSAGEVVEELQYLRELLTVDMADIFVALPARQQLPTLLRLSRVLDRGVANAVVGFWEEHQAGNAIAALKAAGERARGRREAPVRAPPPIPARHRRCPGG